MAARRAVVPLLLLSLFGSNCVGEQARNGSCGGEEVKLHITGSLNSTGQPYVQARLEQPTTSAPRRLDVRMRNEPCGPNGAAMRVIHAVVYGPQEGERLPTPARLQQQADPRLNVVESTATSTPTSSPDSSYTVFQPQTDADPLPQVDLEPLYSGYIKVEGVGRYKVHTQNVRWPRAASMCAREGASLAVPNSQREADALWSLKQSALPPPALALAPSPSRAPSPRGFLGMAVQALQRNTFFVGIRRRPGNTNFTTIFGDELTETGYNTWATPPSTEEHCGAMFSNLGLQAVGCESDLSFICELPL